MKKLKNLEGVEILTIEEKKSINGGGIGAYACYCPGTNILADIIIGSDDCRAAIEANCYLPE